MKAYSLRVCVQSLNLKIWFDKEVNGSTEWRDQNVDRDFFPIPNFWNQNFFLDHIFWNQNIFLWPKFPKPSKIGKSLETEIEAETFEYLLERYKTQETVAYL